MSLSHSEFAVARRRALISLHHDPDLRIFDYRCRHGASGIGNEECSPRHEFVFPRAGVYVKHLGRERLLADLNQVLFFNAGETYRISHPLDKGDRCTTIWVKDGDLLDLLTAFDPNVEGHPEAPFGLTHGPLTARAALLHRRLHRYLAGPEKEGVAPGEIVFDLLSEAVAAAYARRSAGSAPARVRTLRTHRDAALAAATFLNRCFAERLTVHQIASAIGASPFHLCRVFRRETGFTMHRYLTRLRLRVALEPIAGGERDLSDLALSVGFTDHSHFTNAFRREFGMPPSRFRRIATPGGVRRMSKNLQA